jgi:hypothetical protein
MQEVIGSSPLSSTSNDNKSCKIAGFLQGFWFFRSGLRACFVSAALLEKLLVSDSARVGFIAWEFLPLACCPASRGSLPSAF